MLLPAAGLCAPGLVIDGLIPAAGRLLADRLLGDRVPASDGAALHIGRAAVVDRPALVDVPQVVHAVARVAPDPPGLVHEGRDLGIVPGVLWNGTVLIPFAEYLLNIIKICFFLFVFSHIPLQGRHFAVRFYCRVRLLPEG